MRKKINIKLLDKQVRNYFEINKNLTKEGLLRVIVSKTKPVINNWVKFKYSFYSTGCNKVDDITNIIYSKLLDICFKFDAKKKIPFSNYFYNCIKISILNEFGKGKSRQQLFESKLTWYSESVLDSFSNLNFYSYPDEKYQVIKKDTTNFLQTLNKKEILYLKRKERKNNFYSSNKTNLMINNLKSKAEKFFN